MPLQERRSRGVYSLWYGRPPPTPFVVCTVTDSVCTAARVGATLTRWMRRYLVGGRAGDDKAPAVANQAMKRRRAATNDVLDPEAVEELQVRPARPLSTYRVQTSLA